LHRILKLSRVDDPDQTNIHFGTQKSPIFLLNEPESKAASFFASSSDAAVLVEMQKRHRAKRVDRERDEKRLKDEVDELDRELEALRPLKAIAEDVALAENEHQELGELNEAIRDLDREVNELESKLAEHARLCRYVEVLKQVQPTPELADTSPLETAIRCVAEAQQNVDEDQARTTALKTLKAPLDLEDVRALKATIRELAAATEHVGFLTQRIARLATLRETPVFSDTASIEGMINALDSAQQLVRRLGHRNQLLGMLRPVPELSDPSPLERFVELLAVAEVLASERSVARSRLPAILAGGFLLAIVLVLVLFAPTWFSERTRHPDPRPGGDSIAAAHVRPRLEVPPTEPPTKPTAMPENETGKIQTAKDSGVDPPKDIAEEQPSKSTQKEGPAEIGQKRSANEPAKKVPREPTEDHAKKQVVDEKRLQQVRQLLTEARKASEEARFLDAILGFGQAAVLFPDELAAAERPEKVRTMFLEALRRYQSQVEQALEKADKAKRVEK